MRVPKIGKATISYVVSVRLSAWNKSAPTADFHEISYFNIFQNSVEKIQVSLENDKNKRLLDMKIYVHLWPYFANFLLE